MSVSNYWITGHAVRCNDGMLWPHWALMTRRSQEGLVRLNPARFGVRCKQCHQWIDEGEYSYWDRKTGNLCQRCVK